jgi:hypothetical protein
VLAVRLTWRGPCRPHGAGAAALPAAAAAA